MKAFTINIFWIPEKNMQYNKISVGYWQRHMVEFAVIEQTSELSG